MADKDITLFPDHDCIWVADYSVRKRKKKLFDKDERWRQNFQGIHYTPTPHFDTEIEARRHMVAVAEAHVKKVRKRLDSGERALNSARMRLATAEAEQRGAQ